MGAMSKTLRLTYKRNHEVQLTIKD